jgi:hypothetical protein
VSPVPPSRPSAAGDRTCLRDRRGCPREGGLRSCQRRPTPPLPLVSRRVSPREPDSSGGPLFRSGIRRGQPGWCPGSAGSPLSGMPGRPPHHQRTSPLERFAVGCLEPSPTSSEPWGLPIIGTLHASENRSRHPATPQIGILHNPLYDLPALPPFRSAEASLCTGTRAILLSAQASATLDAMLRRLQQLLEVSQRRHLTPERLLEVCLLMGAAQPASWERGEEQG